MPAGSTQRSRASRRRRDVKCALLPLDTLHRALASAQSRRAMIAGLLLAAGGARRFGSQKLIAPLGGECSFIARRERWRARPIR